MQMAGNDKYCSINCPYDCFFISVKKSNWHILIFSEWLFHIAWANINTSDWHGFKLESCALEKSVSLTLQRSEVPELKVFVTAVSTCVVALLLHERKAVFVLSKGPLWLIPQTAAPKVSSTPCPTTSEAAGRWSTATQRRNLRDSLRMITSKTQFQLHLQVIYLRNPLRGLRKVISYPFWWNVGMLKLHPWAVSNVTVD